MIKLLSKIGLYTLIILLLLEGIVRVLHLAKDTPIRYIDEHNVEKWVANQTGYSVTGNRKQNFSKYKINNFGYNSYREFTPTDNKREIALVGDSFFQGFHQDYNNSIGKKIENSLPNVEVYEYAYAGYDFADQLHLINAYKKNFELIDYVVVYLNFEDDLLRSQYKISHDRLALQSPKNLILKKIKLLVYLKNIGVLDSPMSFVTKLMKLITGNNNPATSNISDIKKAQEKKEQTTEYINNFKKLVNIYGFNKTKFSLLLDSRKTPKNFLNYLNANNFHIIDYSKEFKTATAPTYLIYDQHWNNLGRTLIAKQITKNYQERSSLK